MIGEVDAATWAALDVLDDWGTDTNGNGTIEPNEITLKCAYGDSVRRWIQVAPRRSMPGEAPALHQPPAGDRRSQALRFERSAAAFAIQPPARRWPEVAP